MCSFMLPQNRRQPDTRVGKRAGPRHRRAPDTQVGTQTAARYGRGVGPAAGFDRKDATRAQLSRPERRLLACRPGTGAEEGTSVSIKPWRILERRAAYPNAVSETERHQQ